MKVAFTKKFELKKYYKALLLLVAMVIGLNILGQLEIFSDFYTNNIYGYIASGLGYVFNIVPFAAGEMVMYMAIICVIFSVLFGITACIFRKKLSVSIKKFGKIYYKSVLMIFVIFLLIYTLNWTIPLRAGKIDVNKNEDRKYTATEIFKMRAYMAEKLNDEAEKITRDDNGKIIYENKNTLEKNVNGALINISGDYKRLKGYYPSVKTAGCSDFLEWMGIGGFTYPFTMEITSNKYNESIYEPVLYAHEKAHHKGYYRESEADFLSYIACVNSDDSELRYSAYREMYYLFDNLCQSLTAELDSDEKKFYWDNQPVLSETVEKDEQNFTEEYLKEYNDNVNKFLEQNVSDTADTVAEAGWDTQADILGEDNYSGSVKLLLEYYENTVLK